MTLPKIKRFLSTYTSNVLLKYGLDTEIQTGVENPETEKSNMTTSRPFWKLHCWKSIGFVPYTQFMCYWNLDMIFRAKLYLESGNWKTQNDYKAVILKVMSLKIKRLSSMATDKMHMKFETEIPKQTWVTLRKPCNLQSPKTKKSSMAARCSFWKWHCWKSIGQ